MILGTGNDLIDIRRIEETLERFGSRFENRVFTAREQGKAKSRSNAGSRIIAATYAKRFAAKEACAKALGTGIRQGVAWRDMEVTNLASGAPTMTLYGKALQRLNDMTPKGSRTQILLTMTDEYPMAQATVVIEAITA